MLANDFDLVFAQYYRLGKSPKHFNICTKLEKLNWEPDLRGHRDAPLSVVAHWKLTIGNMGVTVMQSHRIFPLVGTWNLSAMC